MIAMIVVYVIVGFNLLLAAHFHGKPKENWSFPATLISQLLSLLLIWWVNGWNFI